MGRAKGKHDNDAFGQVVGAARGTVSLADSPDQARALIEQVRTGRYDEALDVLRVHRRRMHLSHVAELAGELAASALDAQLASSAPQVVRARAFLELAGVRALTCDHVIADPVTRELHIWPTGHVHAVDVLASGETSIPLRHATCGAPVVARVFERAGRGSWAQTQAGHSPWTRCERCAQAAHNYPDCAEAYPGPLFVDDEAIRARMQAAGPQVMPAALEGEPSLWSVQEALADAHREAVLDKTSELAATLPPWQTWRMLGPQAVRVLKASRASDQKLNELLTKPQWRELLGAHWPTTAVSGEQVEAFRADLSDQLVAAAGVKSRAVR